MGTNGYTNGVTLSAHERLQARLADPHTVDALNALLDKLDVINFSVDALDGFIRRGDEVTDALAGSVQDLRQLAPGGDTLKLAGKLPQLAKTGAQLADLTETPAFQNLAASGLLEQLGKPDTIAALQMLLSKLDLISFFVQALDGFLKRGDDVIDAVAAGVADLKASAPDLKALDLGALGAAAPKLSKAASQLADSGLLDKVQPLAKAGSDLADSGLLSSFPALTQTLIALVNSGIFDGKTVGILAEAGKTLAQTYDEAAHAPPRKAGLGGLLGALGDPDIQRSLGLLLDFAKRFGQKLK